jgi:hypothetical protein
VLEASPVQFSVQGKGGETSFVKTVRRNADVLGNVSKEEKMKRVLGIAFLLVVATAFNVLVVGQRSVVPPAVVIPVSGSWTELTPLVFDLDPFPAVLYAVGSGSYQGQIVITPVKDEDILPHKRKENIRLTFTVAGSMWLELYTSEQVGLFQTIGPDSVNGRLELHLGATPGVYDVQGIMILGGYVLTLKTDNQVFIPLLGYPVTHFHMANGRVLIAR